MTFSILQKKQGLGSTTPTPIATTRLLLHCDSFFNSSNETHTLTTQGTLSIVTDVKRFNNGSIYFNNGSITTTKTNSLCLYSFSQFSIDAWVNIPNFTNQSYLGKPVLIGSMNTEDDTIDWSFGLNESGIMLSLNSFEYLLFIIVVTLLCPRA